MKSIKLILVSIFLLVFSATWADIALPKGSKQDTKYYFANVDSFPGFSFQAIKKVENKKYRIKQNNYILLKVKDGEQKLEIWAVNKKDNSKTNALELNLANTYLQEEDKVANIAILFKIEKDGILSYTSSIVTPQCYKKSKQFTPFINFNFNTSNRLGLLAVYSFFILIIIWVINKTKLRKNYV